MFATESPSSGEEQASRHRQSWLIVTTLVLVILAGGVVLLQVGAEPWLGVAISSGSSAGCVVVEVIPGQAAEQAGVKEGDVILELDGKPTPDPRALIDAVGRCRVGDKVTLTIVSSEADHPQVELTAELTLKTTWFRRWLREWWLSF